MFALYKIIGAFAAPPGLFIAALLAAASAAFVTARRPRRHGRNFTPVALVLFAAVLYVMSTPAGALLTAGPLESAYSVQLPPEGEDAAFVVLAGGSSYDGRGSSVQPSPQALERVYAAVTLASQRDGNSVLVMSGGNVFGDNDRSEASAMRDAARAMGWRGETVLEEESRTTAENMKYCAGIVRSLGIENVAVVTNAYHMPRAMYLARRFMPGARLYPCPGPRQADPLVRGLPSFLPAAGSLDISCSAAREWIGIAASAAASLRK